MLARHLDRARRSRGRWPGVGSRGELLGGSPTERQQRYFPDRRKPRRANLGGGRAQSLWTGERNAARQPADYHSHTLSLAPSYEGLPLGLFIALAGWRGRARFLQHG